MNNSIPIKRQLLVMMLGVPGSGKSSFARQLAAALDFQRVSTDAIRTQLFGRPDPRPPKRYSDVAMALMNLYAEDALATGRSVIRDHMHHSKHWQELGRKQAAAVGALPVMVWIRVPHDLAHRRGMERRQSHDQRNEVCPDRMKRTIDHYHNTLDLQDPSNLCLEIDGRLPFKKQLRRFIDFCQQHQDASVDIVAQGLESPDSTDPESKDSFDGGRQTIVVMTGPPGSGKSFFARQLAFKLHWRRLNRVALRQELFGDQGLQKLPANEVRLNRVLEERLHSMIRAGQSVICDYQHNSRVQRLRVRQLATANGARMFVVWIKTPRSLAIQRASTRQANSDTTHRPTSYAQQMIDDNLAKFEPLGQDESVLEIDGSWNFSRQMDAFIDYWQKVHIREGV